MSGTARLYSRIGRVSTSNGATVGDPALRPLTLRLRAPHTDHTAVVATARGGSTLRSRKGVAGYTWHYQQMWSDAPFQIGCETSPESLNCTPRQPISCGQGRELNTFHVITSDNSHYVL